MTHAEAIQVLKTDLCADCSWGSSTPIECDCPSCPVKEALRLAIAALERDEWISVEEPPVTGWYLVLCNQWGGRIHRLAFCRDGIWTEWTDKGYDITEYVTHYRPLPEPPKEET